MEKEQAEKLLKTVDQMAKEFREILFGKNVEKDELTYDPSNLANGLYRIYWKDGDSSLAAVGCLANGTRWYAPTNWINLEKWTDWDIVSHVGLIEKESH